MSTMRAARDAIECLMICNLMAKLGLTIESAEEAEAALRFGAKISSLANRKEVTPDAWRKKLNRVMKIYTADPESAAVMRQVSAGLAEFLETRH